MVFHQKLWEKVDFIFKMAGSLWSGQPALTFGKRPKLPRRLVLSHNACPQERCVTSSKTAAKERLRKRLPRSE